MKKESQKPRLKLKKYILNIYGEYLLCLQSSASGSFLQTYINFVEQRNESNFLTLRDNSIIP